jgi:cell shape-determining protein MreC
MFQLKFNQVFVGLLGLSFLSAFVVPARFTNPVRNLQGLFAPVARPARALGYALHARFARPETDNRSVADVKDENIRLRAELASLTGQLDELKRINGDRERLGDLRPLCTPFPVLGSDPASRDSLVLAASSRDGLAPDMPVLYPYGLVGEIDRVGPGGAQVQLVTDRQFRAGGRFKRMVKNERGEITYISKGRTMPVVEGAGKGEMVVRNVPLRDTGSANDGILVGDLLALEDPERPTNLRDQWLGRVESIEPQPKAPQYAEIRIKPIKNLAGLREVMVMNKGPGSGIQASAKTATLKVEP